MDPRVKAIAPMVIDVLNMVEQMKYQEQSFGRPSDMVHDYVERKRDAFRAHVSQNDPNSWFATMASQIYELAFGTEYYQLVRGKAGSDLPEPDLFAGIS